MFFNFSYNFLLNSKCLSQLATLFLAKLMSVSSLCDSMMNSLIYLTIVWRKTPHLILKKQKQNTFIRIRCKNISYAPETQNAYWAPKRLNTDLRSDINPLTPPLWFDMLFSTVSLEAFRYLYVLPLASCTNKLHISACFLHSNPY